MAFVHSKYTVVKVAGTDISTYCTNSEFEKSAKTHDLTTYGKDAEVYGGGLLSGAFTVEGDYDSTASTGPRALLNSLVGTTVAIIRQPEGAGAGKPQDSFSAVVGKYKETSPVNDYVKWTCDFQPSDTINSAAQ